MQRPTVTVVGNLTADPEMRFTTGGDGVASFSLAVNLRKHVAGEWIDADPEFHDVVAWKHLGDAVAETLVKGMRVLVTGELQVRKWVDADGNNRYKTQIVADEVGASIRFHNVSATKREHQRPAMAGTAPAPQPALAGFEYDEEPF
jgi:single-strand DNA-binding protein